jgi:hypothetical protein
MLVAAPHAHDAAVNVTRPMRRIGLRPKTSEQRAKMVRKPLMVSFTLMLVTGPTSVRKQVRCYDPACLAIVAQAISNRHQSCGYDGSLEGG